MVTPQMFVKLVSSGAQLQAQIVGSDDSSAWSLGDDGDVVFFLRSTALGANTALSGVLVGTPVTPAITANSAIISNITTDGDILFAVSDGGHSKGLLKLDGSEGTVLLDGNVGIGVEIPGVALDVDDDTNNPQGKFTRNTDASSSLKEVLSLKAYSTGNMIDNFGPGLEFIAADSGNSDVLGEIGAVRDGGDTSGALVFVTRTLDTASEKMRINNGGDVFIGPAQTDGTYSNGKMTRGLTINVEDAGDEAFAIKASNSLHTMTAKAEADTFFTITKADGSSGGAHLHGYKSDADTAGKAVMITGLLDEAADETVTTSAIGIVQIRARIGDGTSAQAIAADGNVLVVSNETTAAFLVKGDGQLYAADPTVATFDSYDDAQLIRALDHTRQSPTMIRERWDDFIKYNEQDLVEAGILGDTRENGGLLNVTGLQRLHNGAIWQGYVRQQDMQEKIDTLENRLLAIEGAK